MQAPLSTSKGHGRSAQLESSMAPRREEPTSGPTSRVGDGTFPVRGCGDVIGV